MKMSDLPQGQFVQDEFIGKDKGNQITDVVFSRTRLI